VHEYILQIYGLDVNRSLKFWEPYLRFELDLLAEMAGNEGSKPEEVGKQEGRVRSIYRRRVIFPTADSVLTWNEYGDWEKDRDEFAKVEERHR
jgi:hypothetical protein